MLKIAYFLRNLQTSRTNNSRILRTKNAKFSGYCFYMNTKAQGNFQICISVPLSTIRILIGRLTCYFIPTPLSRLSIRLQFNAEKKFTGNAGRSRRKSCGGRAKTYRGHCDNISGLDTVLFKFFNQTLASCRVKT